MTAGVAAGGLIGEAGDTTIKYSYSTCSATGATVGGFIGTGNGQIQHSYCTGLVKGTGNEAEGAFAGAWSYSGKADSDGNWYYDIINEREEKDAEGNPTGGYTYLTAYPAGESETVKVVTALDETASSYNDFCGADEGWKTAMPYKEQTKLETYYGGKYNLQTVKQLGAEIAENSGEEDDTTVTDFVAIHYGDWPAPEIFVVNN